MEATRLEKHVRFFAPLIKDPQSLCGFLGKTEREAMVAQTIHACLTNLEYCGKAFLLKVPLRDGPHCENTAAYDWLIAQVLLRESALHVDPSNSPPDVVRDDSGHMITILPTEALFAKLAGHFGVLPK